jgi:hypothetical protein
MFFLYLSLCGVLPLYFIGRYFLALHLISGSTPYNKMTASILKECHETFVSCFHAFYPTAFLKWTCLCDLLAVMDKVSIIIFKVGLIITLFRISEIFSFRHSCSSMNKECLLGSSVCVCLAHFSWGYSVCMTRGSVFQQEYSTCTTMGVLNLHDPG